LETIRRGFSQNKRGTMQKLFCEVLRKFSIVLRLPLYPVTWNEPGSEFWHCAKGTMHKVRCQNLLPGNDMMFTSLKIK
jgi:hypothetical protein